MRYRGKLSITRPFSIFAVAAFSIISLTGCATPQPGQDNDRPATRPYAGPSAPVTVAWPAAPDLSPDPDGDGLLSVLQQECMADEMNSVWVETAGGMVAAGFVDREDPPQSVYVFEALKGIDRHLPGYGPISAGVVIGEADLQKLRVVKLAAPIRFLRRADGNLTPGFFDPGHRVFFRWRDEVRPPDAERFDFSPEYDPISPVLHPSRVLTTVDIDPPDDEIKSAMGESIRSRPEPPAADNSAHLPTQSGEQSISTTEHIQRLATAGTARERDHAVDALLKQHKQAVAELIALADAPAPVPAQREAAEPVSARVAAVYLLGRMRAAEAVPVLARLLEEEARTPVARSDVSRYDDPMWTALVEIGRPAVPAMLDHVLNTDDARLRTSSINVLYHVLGGKRRVLETLEKLATREKNPVRSNRAKAAGAWARDYYKEDEEPLY